VLTFSPYVQIASLTRINHFPFQKDIYYDAHDESAVHCVRQISISCTVGLLIIP